MSAHADHPAMMPDEWPEDADWGKATTAKLGMWVFLLSDAFMFAGNDFLYNTRMNGGGQAEPQSGFKVRGNFAAINQVVVNRDWYKPDNSGVRAPAIYNHTTGTWQDITGTDLSASEISDLTHYQMELTYDERIWSADTQPPGLPHGIGSIFGGVAGWEEINAGDA